MNVYPYIIMDPLYEYMDRQVNLLLFMSTLRFLWNAEQAKYNYKRRMKSCSTIVH